VSAPTAPDMVTCCTTVIEVTSNSRVSAGTPASPERRDFIRDIVAADVREGRVSEVVTRFPPEPNGYLHLGHSKAIALGFGIAQEFGGRCHLRFDDTNPVGEEQEYIDSIQEDIRWLGFDWGEHLCFASDYFGQLYDWAVHLIRGGKAYVDDLSADKIREHRGTLTEPGSNSPWRDRPVDENLGLFERMRAGEFPDGARVLRAKIDMASPNINMRDPVLYRILHATHPRTGDEWCIYPLYDFAHGQSDAIEGITHSLCTLEFEAHRPLYDWMLENLPVPSRPRQYEFARLNFTYTVLSKRFLRRLVSEGHVRGWDDPRMPTLSALRRRGFPAEGLRNFLNMVSLGSKGASAADIEMLEHEVRDVLNRRALRRFAVLHPLRLVIENYPEGQVEEVEAVNNPEDPSAGTRMVPFARELWIERDDFMEDPPGKFFRLAPGREVRLRCAYFVTCTDVVKDANGEIVEIRCSYDPQTRGGDAPDGRRPKATLHWISSGHAVPAQVRIYDRLFTRSDPGADGDLDADLNPDSETVLQECLVEPALTELPAGETVQFERLGYFCPDPDSTPGRLVFNRTLGLRDTWAKLQAQTARP
jgi:glutaminyl-tRNA synthetase